MKRTFLFVFLLISLLIFTACNKITCDNCGEKIKEDLKFCPNCGDTVGQNVNKPDNNTGNNNEKDVLYAPTESYVISCLNKVPGILEIAAVTEDNDPNGNLNKQGGYTSQVYFSYSLVDQTNVIGDDLIEKGTDAGGSIEVYTTVEYANKRNEYLSAFDGSALASGSHIVVGTIVIRTSDELTASEQKLLESNIIYALKGELDKIIAPSSNNNNNNNNTDTKSAALRSAETFAAEFETEYPDDFLTPNYLNEHLQDVLGYSVTDANYAVENANISWLNHANKYALVYLTYVEEFGEPASWFGASNIESMLLDDGFTSGVIKAAINRIDWTLQSKKYVKHLSDFYDTFNRLDARGYLADIVANDADIDFLLENSGVDWNTHALNMANELWSQYIAEEDYQGKTVAYIQADIVDELLNVWEYTESEIDYAMENMTVEGIMYDDPQYLEYTLNSDNTYTVTGIGLFNGSNLIIPSTYGGKKVTAIGEFAFWECLSLETVTIGGNITEIGTYAFAECDNLEVVNIPDSVTTVGEYVFYWCPNLTTVNISSNSRLTKIGESMFHWCEKLTTVTIPNNVTRIENYAFYGCYSLTSINIPSTVTYIGDSAFSDAGLTSIIIPMSVKTIDRAAFCNCTSLTSFNYAGTMYDWNKVTKGSQWADYSAFKNVVCSNGTVSVK